MILLVDNYDSFSFNLVQLIGEIAAKKEEVRVIRNDEMTVEQIVKEAPSHIVLSPGPGKPADAGICEKLIMAAKEKQIPLLGVCLGHQAICEAFGGKITYAKQLMHGKQSTVWVERKCKLFAGFEENIKVARYHSLIAPQEHLPEELQVMARDEQKEVMAVKHRDCEIYGVQFHPESIMTPQGRTMIEAFLA